MALWARVVRAGSETGDSRVSPKEDDGGEKIKRCKRDGEGILP